MEMRITRRSIIFVMDGVRADDILNSLSAHVAVLDAAGAVISVNESWLRYSRDNGGAASGFVGANYLAVCERAASSGDAVAAAALKGIRAVMAGERSSFRLEYPCVSSKGTRWFGLGVTRLSRDTAASVVISHEDITEQKNLEYALRDTQDTLRHILELLPVGVWILDKEGRITHGNPAGRRIWAGARYVGPEEFGEYRGWWMDSGKAIAPEEWAAVRAIRKGETSIDEEVRIQCFDGSTKIILNSAIPLHDAERRVTGAIIVNQDITARKQQELELLRIRETLESANRELQASLNREQVRARTDELTGLHNRRYFLELAERECSVATRHERPLSVVMIDIDHFKQINDTFGHQAGDEVLARVATTVAAQRRTGDIVARYGGEEFMLLLPETTAENALLVAEHLRSAVAADGLDTPAGRAKFTISAGVAALDANTQTLEQLIRQADQALYAAKAQGRNRAVLQANVQQVA
jgi:diguanylate cyclase (GGDEF)-like protein